MRGDHPLSRSRLRLGGLYDRPPPHRTDPAGAAARRLSPGWPGACRGPAAGGDLLRRGPGTVPRGARLAALRAGPHGRRRGGAAGAPSTRPARRDRQPHTPPPHPRAVDQAAGCRHQPELPRRSGRLARGAPRVQSRRPPQPTRPGGRHHLHPGLRPRPRLHARRRPRRRVLDRRSGDAGDSRGVGLRAGGVRRGAAPHLCRRAHHARGAAGGGLGRERIQPPLRRP